MPPTPSPSTSGVSHAFADSYLQDSKHHFSGLLLIIIALSGGLLHAEQATPKSWSQFLGPRRNSVSTETNLIDRFPASGPKIVWRAEGGVLTALNLTDGKLLWRFGGYLVC